MDSHLIG